MTTNTNAAPDNCTILPDGSAFALASYTLPKDHWLYAPREYEPGAEEPKELPHPILTHAQSAEVVAAVRYAIRGATMCGKEEDFDPDALVQNAVYALCGPFKKTSFPAAAQPPADGALNTIAAMFHSAEEIEGPDGLAMMVDMSPAAQCPTSVDVKTMELAESVGLIGPASRTHDLHAAIQRFHDLVCVNATIKAAQMASDAIREAAPAAQGDALDRGVREELSIGKAINRAARDLPEGWEIRIDLERHAGVVFLIDPDGNETMSENGEFFSDQINAAIDAARGAQGESNEPV